MFSGIISQKVKVNKIEKLKNSLEIYFDVPTKIYLEEGESVSLNGICSTVSKISKNSFLVHYMKETLDNTKAESLVAGHLVNFEQSLKWNDKVSGHFVSGHIDCVGKIADIDNKNDTVLRIKIPAKFLKYVTNKGSISIDGVSLTVSKKTRGSFEVSLIPYTLSHTTLGDLKKGDFVNIETDLLAKYAENLNAKKKK